MNVFAKDGNPEKSGCPQLGAWWATVHGGGKELDITEATELSMALILEVGSNQ